MQNSVWSGIILFLVACGQKPAAAQPASQRAPEPQEIIEAAAAGGDSFLPDYSFAGYGFGIEELPRAEGVVIDPGEFGALPDDGLDDSAGIQASLLKAKATVGPVIIRFRPGRYELTEVLTLDRSDLVIQGAGRGVGGTEIHIPRPLAMVDTGSRFDELRDYLKRYTKRQREPEKNLDVLFSEYSWTGAFFWIGREEDRAVPYLKEKDQPIEPMTMGVEGRRGEFVLTVRETEGLTAGDWITIAWFSDEPDSGIIRSIYGETELEIGSHHWNFEDRPLVRHRTKIVSVDGNALQLASPLPHPVSAAVPAEVFSWNPLERVGLEDFRITFPNAAVFGHHVERGYNGVYFTGAADGWIRHVAVVNADAGVLTDDASNLTFSDLLFTGVRKGHYAVHMGSVGNVLAENIIVNVPVIHSLTFNTKSTRSVYKDAVVHFEPVLDQHAGSNHQNLFDRVTLHLTADRGDQGPYYDVFDGSGAPYWQPGHGRYNTVWNLKLLVEGGAMPDEQLDVLGLAEGPGARIVGLHANRSVALDYRPQPLVSHLGQRVEHIPSLYEHQLQQRKMAQ